MTPLQLLSEYIRNVPVAVEITQNGDNEIQVSILNDKGEIDCRAFGPTVGSVIETALKEHEKTILNTVPGVLKK